MKFLKNEPIQDNTETADGESACFVLMFRHAPPGSTLFFGNTAKWCVAMARHAGRKIKTHKSVSITPGSNTAPSITKDLQVQETTRVQFIDEPYSRIVTRAKPRPSHQLVEDPRQILIPGIGA